MFSKYRGCLVNIDVVFKVAMKVILTQTISKYRRCLVNIDVVFKVAMKVIFDTNGTPYQFASLLFDKAAATGSGDDIPRPLI